MQFEGKYQTDINNTVVFIIVGKLYRMTIIIKDNEIRAVDTSNRNQQFATHTVQA